VQGSTSVLNGGATTLVRANNSIGYFLPAMGGLYGQVMVAAAEGNPNGNKYIGARLGYAAGPVNVAVALGNTEATATRDVKGMNVGASFNAGFMTIMAQYHKYTVDNTSGVDPSQTNMLIGANFPVGAGTFKVSYGKANSTGTNFDATQVAAGYVHDLSKRTSLYTHFAKISNEAGARYAASGSGPTFSGSNNKPGSTAYEFGVRHSF
jgi:predicted porin